MLTLTLYGSLHEEDVLDSGHSVIRESCFYLSRLINSPKPVSALSASCMVAG